MSNNNLFMLYCFPMGRDALNAGWVDFYLQMIHLPLHPDIKIEIKYKLTCIEKSKWIKREQMDI